MATKYLNHLLSKYLLSTYYVLGIFLIVEDIGVNKVNENF